MLKMTGLHFDCRGDAKMAGKLKKQGSLHSFRIGGQAFYQR